MSFTHHLSRWLILFLICCPALAVSANELEQNDEVELADFYGDEDFVSIATGTKQLVHKAPAIATVITSEDIRKMNARNLSEVLDTVPGLHASRSGQLLAPEYWFRGITSTFNPQTLMMINGVSTKSSMRGDNHVVWGEFPIHSIHRIEIIRGPGSALYGADAFSGVINIITKKASSQSENEFGGMLGSFNTKNVWGNHHFTAGDWKIATNFEYLSSDGYKGIIDSDAQTLIDQFGSGLGAPPVSLAPGQLSNQFTAIDFWFSAESDTYNIDIGTLQRNDLGSRLGATEVLDTQGVAHGYKNIISLILKEKPIAANLSLKSKLSFYGSSQEIDENFLLFPEGAFFGAFPNGFIGNPGWEEETTKFELDLSYTGLAKSSILFGLGYERQNLYKVVEQKNFLADLSPRPAGLEDVSDTPEVFMPEADRESQFLYFQSVSQIAPDWELTAGARFDDYTDFGSTFNPRIALVWSTSLKLTTKFLYGRAFRAPSFAELIAVNNPIALGNPALNPETIDTIELAFNYNHSENFSYEINIYSYSIEDFITFVPDINGQTSTAQNVGERSGKGLEATMDYRISENLVVVGNIAYVNAKDNLADDDVGEYPNWQSYFRAEYAVSDSWNITTQISHIADRQRVPNDLRNKLSGYTTVHLGADFRFSESNTILEFSFSNVFDEDVREPSSANMTFGSLNIPNDIPQAGKAFYIGVRSNY